MGDQPDVLDRVYVVGFAPDVGESPGRITEQKPPVGAASIAPHSDGYMWIEREKFHDSFCQDLSAEQTLVMAVTQKAPLGPTFQDTITAPVWKVTPTWYQVSANDRMIDPDNERRMAERMGP